MIYPSIDKLFNVVDSKYRLVYVAAKRSKQMKETHYYQLKESEYVSTKDIGRALEELSEGLIQVKMD